MYLTFSCARFSLLAVVRYVPSMFRLQRCVAIGLSCLALSVGAAQTNSSAVDSSTNPPNIYVDYDRDQIPSKAVVAATNGLGCWIWDKQTPR